MGVLNVLRVFLGRSQGRGRQAALGLSVEGRMRMWRVCVGSVPRAGRDEMWQLWWFSDQGLRMGGDDSGGDSKNGPAW